SADVARRRGRDSCELAKKRRRLRTIRAVKVPCRCPSTERNRMKTDRVRRSRVPHSTRPELKGAAHVVLRIRRGLPGLRTPRAYRVLERAFRRGKSKDGFRLIEYSVQHDHLHLIVEADHREQLARGMQGLMIRIAKGLNRFWHRRVGHVFADRYFALAM